MTPADPLRLLASGVLPAGIEPARSSRGLSSAEAASADFRQLLLKAHNDELASGRALSLAPGVNVPLSEDQSSRLSLAADRAEAAGARHAIVLLDDQALRIDVANRQILGTVDLSQPGVLTGIDAVVRAGGGSGADPAGDGARGLVPPGLNAAALAGARWHPSLARVLGEPQADRATSSAS